MNAYYNENQRGYEKEGGRAAIELICSAVAFLTSATAIKIEKVIISAVCFISVFGIVGGIDNGAINFFGGALACLALVCIEYCILRSIFPKRRSDGAEEIELDLSELELD